MKLCPKCGYSNNDKDLKCKNCYEDIENVKTYNPQKDAKVLKTNQTSFLNKKYARVPLTFIIGCIILVLTFIDLFTGFITILYNELGFLSNNPVHILYILIAILFIVVSYKQNY